MNDLLAKAQSKANDLKNKALGLTPLQVKVNDATNDEPTGPHGRDMQDLADASYHSEDRHVILSMLFQKLRCEGKQWRQCYKSLLLLEALCTKGPMKIAASVKDNSMIISTVARNFNHIDERGIDQGMNVRERAKKLNTLVTDFDLLQQERERAALMKERMEGGTSTTTPTRRTERAGYSSKPSSGYDDYDAAHSRPRRSDKSEREKALEREEKAFAEQLRSQQNPVTVAAPIPGPSSKPAARRPAASVTVKAPPSEAALQQRSQQVQQQQQPAVQQPQQTEDFAAFPAPSAQPQQQDDFNPRAVPQQQQPQQQQQQQPEKPKEFDPFGDFMSQPAPQQQSKPDDFFGSMQAAQPVQQQPQQQWQQPQQQQQQQWQQQQQQQWQQQPQQQQQPPQQQADPFAGVSTSQPAQQDPFSAFQTSSQPPPQQQQQQQQPANPFAFGASASTSAPAQQQQPADPFMDFAAPSAKPDEKKEKDKKEVEKGFLGDMAGMLANLDIHSSPRKATGGKTATQSLSDMQKSTGPQQGQQQPVPMGMPNNGMQMGGMQQQQPQAFPMQQNTGMYNQGMGGMPNQMGNQMPNQMGMQPGMQQGFPMQNQGMGMPNQMGMQGQMPQQQQQQQQGFGMQQNTMNSNNNNMFGF